MKLEGEFARARLVERHNKYVATIRLQDSDEEAKAHVPDPGRLKEILYPNAEIVVRKEDTTKRKTAYTIVGVKAGQIWVNIQATFTNRLFEEEYKTMPSLKDYIILKREHTFGESRIDFLMENQITKKKALLEVKSSTLVKNNQALFPDAPTTRGVKHIKELTKALEEGYTSIVVFVIKREDATSLSPNKSIDPLFSKTIANAVEAGVKVLVFRTAYDPLNKCELRIEKEVPFIL